MIIKSIWKSLPVIVILAVATFTIGCSTGNGLFGGQGLTAGNNPYVGASCSGST